LMAHDGRRYLSLAIAIGDYQPSRPALARPRPLFTRVDARDRARVRAAFRIHSSRRARRACEGAARGDGAPASDRAGVWGGAPPEKRRSDGEKEDRRKEEGWNQEEEDGTQKGQREKAGARVRLHR